LAHLDVIKAPSVAVFGDDSGSVYALDAQRGTLVWKTQVESHPLARIVGAPTLYNNRLFVSVGSIEEAMAAGPGYACCTFRGSVAALDVATGKVLWKSFTVLEEPQPTRKSSTRNPGVRARRRSRGGCADHRCEARCAVRGYGRIDHQRRAVADRRRRGLRFEQRQSCVG
jgi:outer membrane protein assembly factor BamB